MMENQLTAPVYDGSFFGKYVRRHSSSTGCTPPKSPIFLIHKPPSTPNDLSANGDLKDRPNLSPLNRFLSTPTKKVCTMDCAHCRHVARSLRPESPSFAECLSAPCSRKSSVGHNGKNWFISN